MINVENLVVELNNKRIVNDISFTVPEKQHVYISGPSGSGKSTLLKVLAGLVPFTSGDIFYNDKNILQIDPIAYRQEVSYCYQQPTLFGNTVRDNLAFPYEIRKEPFDEEKAISLLKEVGLASGFLDKKITELSGGERQRVAMIRNLIFEPKVLLLDEVTTGLDSESKRIVRKLINDKEKSGMSILEITHDKSEIDPEGRLIMIEDGEIING